MKKFFCDFVKRGLMAAWGGPVVVTIIYAVLGWTGVVETFTTNEVCMAILSSTLMAFIAAGIPAIYQVERLPLLTAILIHCAVLYLDYLLVYLMNGWLKNQLTPILIFTVFFVAGYALIWLIIYLVNRRNVEKLNEKLSQQ